MTNKHSLALNALRHGARCTEDETRAVALAAIVKFGGITAAARVLGVSRQTIADWRDGKHTAPQKMKKLLESLD